jgi:hypothetical protein
MNISDHISESLETFFWFKILKLFDADPDPGWKILDPGSGINIPDPQHWAHLLRLLRKWCSYVSQLFVHSLILFKNGG